MEQPGFMIYAEDWLVYAEEYNTEEIGTMVKALLAYFSTGEHTDFSDRGMRQFYRQATKAIDLDRKHYEDKCLHNAHNRYKGLCKKKGLEPLDFEEWLTMEDDCQRPSTKPTNNNNQLPIIKDQSPVINSQWSEGMQGETQRNREIIFEDKREAALKALQGYQGY